MFDVAEYAGRAAAGDRDALAVLMYEYRPRLVGFANQRLSDTDTESGTTQRAKMGHPNHIPL